MGSRNFSNQSGTSRNRKGKGNQNNQNRPFIENLKKPMLVLPLIPLEHPTKVTFVKGEYIVVKCRSDPTNTDFPTYELPIPYFRSGTPEVYLKWLANARKVCVGQNCQSGPEKFGMYLRLLEGEAKAVFSMASSTVTENDAGLDFCIQALDTHVFPTLAAVMQMRHMKIFMKKPVDLLIREYVARILGINAYFPDYLEPIPGIKETKINDRDNKDLAEFGLPAHWKRAMLHQNFMFIEHSLSDMVSFCERLQMTDPHGTPGQKKAKNVTYIESVQKVGQTKRKADNSDNVCIIHGVGHNNKKCWVILKAQKKLKLKKKEEPIKKTLLSIYRSATHKVSNLKELRRTKC